MLNPLRRRLNAAVERRVDARLVPQLDELARVRTQDSDAATARAADYEARLGGLQADYDYLRSEFDRIAPQLAALEYRFERLRETAQAPSLDSEKTLELARLEHARARLRLELVAHYEERLCRLEADHG